jgi:hypothetical protein
MQVIGKIKSFCENRMLFPLFFISIFDIPEVMRGVTKKIVLRRKILPTNMSLSAAANH